MTSEQFLKEVLNSNICPENFEKLYRDFQKYQKAAIDTLLEFHRVCVANDIKYQLAYGSLLGVIRDNGQIPWDYDVDVFVAYKDKVKLIEALDTNLNDRFYYYCPEKNIKCRHVIMRLAPKEYRSEALHVDVFYYIGSPNDEKERNIFAKKIKDKSNFRFYKLVKPKEESIGEFRRYCLLWKNKIPYLFKSLKTNTKQYIELCEQYSLENSDYVIPADSFADSFSCPKRLLTDTMLIKSDIGEFYIPLDYENVLKFLYNNYKEVPTLESRINEVLKSYQRLCFFDNKK